MNLEEKRQIIDLEIEVITSAELGIGNEFGYDGTAIYLKTNDNIEELYIISQGSQDIKDWEYNAKSMLAGLNISQARSTNNFLIAIKDKLNLNHNIPVIGLSHSLAHNNNLTAHLLYESFDKIYSVNGAQTNYYQLFMEDMEFSEAIQRHFSIPLNKDYMAIYDLDPSELHDFAQDYYKDKIPVVNQRISTDDPLYALNTARGFFQLGNVEYIDTNPDYPGLHSIMKKLPDDIVKDIQAIAIDYATAANIGGSKDGIRAITGIDMDIVQDTPTILKTYTLNPLKFDQMLEDVHKKLPRLLAVVKTLFENSDVVFQEFVNTGYMTPKHKALIIEELQSIEKSITKMETAVSGMMTNRKSGNGITILTGDITASVILSSIIPSISSLYINLRLTSRTKYSRCAKKYYSL